MATPPVSPILPNAPESFATQTAQQSEQAVSSTSSTLRGSPKPHAFHVLASQRRPSALLQRNLGDSRLQDLDAAPFRMVLDNLQHEDPKAIRELSCTSSQMYSKVHASGKLLRNVLCHRAENAWKDVDDGATIVEQVIDAAVDEKNHLVSEDRLAVLASCGSSIRTASVTVAEKIIALVENLRPKHRHEGISHASNAIRPSFEDQTKINFFDRLAKQAVRAKTDEDKLMGLELLKTLNMLPPDERISRFDALAPMWKSITNKEKQFDALVSVFDAISDFSKEPYRNESLETPQIDRHMEYLGQASKLESADIKTSLITYLKAQVRYVIPQENALSFFNGLAALAGSVKHADGRRTALNGLREVIAHLTGSEQNHARTRIEELLNN